MPEVGEQAPDFALRGYHDGEYDTYQLSDQLESERCVLLIFYYCDFSPVCTEQMCAYSDANWYQYKSNLRIFGISRDGPYSHRRFAEANDIAYPLLSDVQGRVCDAFDVLEPGDASTVRELPAREAEVNGVPGLPRRGVFLVAPSGEIRYAWQTEDNWESPTVNHVEKAIESM
jgi:peroxiredoxin